MASAKRTSASTSPSSDFVRLTRNPDLPRSKRFERVEKAPGSFELIDGKLVEVT
jgi:hypothetical protein